MRIKKLLAVPLIATGFLIPAILPAQSTPEIVVSVNKPIAAVQPTMWGIFFEDINFGADGGIYAELVQEPFI